MNTRKQQLDRSHRYICGLLLVITFVTPAVCLAKSQVVAVEGVAFNTSTTIKDNLKSLKGKTVSVYLASGASVVGVVKDVGNHLLHLEKLDRREYFDALIRLDEISAIDTRFRTLQR